MPLAIKALVYIPSHTNEKLGMPQEDGALSLYSRKVLIKANCHELLPGYLRFVKGVVDCEDIPLNISRETYQDTGLMAKLRNVITRRILKQLLDESKAQPEKYNEWYDTFQNFIKEGSQMDSDNKETLFKLMRFNVNYMDSPKKFISLDDYVEKMKEGQKKIYFSFAKQYRQAMESPFYETFKGTDVPVLILTNNLDEFCLSSAGEHKGMQFVNIETA